MELEQDTELHIPKRNAVASDSLAQLADTHLNEQLNSAIYAQREGRSKLRETLRIIHRHRWLIIAIVLLVVPFFTIDAYRNRFIYQATALIEVKREDGLLIKGTDTLFYDSSNNTKAEAYIIKSRPVLERTIINGNLLQNLQLGEARKRPTWEAIKAFLYGEEKPKTDAPAASTSPTPLPMNPAQLSAQDKQKITPLVELLAGDLQVEPVRDTQLLKISFTHSQPDIAALITNGVTENFIKFNFQARTERFTNASDWLEESTRKLQAKVEQAQQKLTNYTQANNIFSLEGKENLTADRLASLHDQAMRAETDRLLKQSLYEEVKQGRVAQLPEAFADPKTAELRKQLNDLSVDAAQLSVRLGQRHPRLVEIRQQIETIQGQINENRATLEEKLRADYERAQRDEESLKAALERAKAAAVQQNQAAIQYSILQQDLITAKALYTDFLNKASQTNIQRAEQHNNVRLIEPAEPPRHPISANRTNRILVGLIVSLVMGVGLAFLLEQLNTKVRNVEDVARFSPFPSLGVIPNLEKQTGTQNDRKQLTGNMEMALAQKQPVSQEELMRTFTAGAEAYRMLRTSVMLSTAGRPPKTILFTSGEPGDGKTTTLFNTAIAFTQLNASVLIIDCDMRKPRIHKVALMDRGQGISTLLSSGAELDDCIRPTEIPNLSILPSGPIPPNPSELISSTGMRNLLAELSERYDHILIDSPPLATVTDPLILSTLVEGVILITKSGKSHGDIVRRVCLELLGVGAKVLGVVLNDFNLKKEGYDYYYYYRYDYEYAQSSGDSSKLD